jgi:hypothetical protein
MPLKNLDFLSPKISLFFYGRRRHSAFLGGVLTILMVISCLTYIFYLCLDVCRHNSSTLQYYRHLFKDPEVFLFNKTKGIFHFFQFYSPKNKSYYGKFNSKYIRFFMTSISDEYKTNPQILSENEHWVYDNCRDRIDNEFIDDDIFTNTSFEYGICLRYYYNKIDKKYYPIEDTNNFIYPHLANIELNMNYSIATVIEKCDNNSILTEALGFCADEKEIQNYLKDNYGLNFNVLQHEINPDNYSNPIYKFIYGISSILQSSKINEHNIIFVPLKTDIKGGLVLPKRKQKLTYSFYDYYKRDEELNTNNNKIISIYNFCLSPAGYVFKSDYETIYDCFPKMGGIIQLIYYLFFGINFFYNKFTIINDTKRLFFQLNNNERANRNIQILHFSKAVNSLRRVSSKIIYKLKDKDKKKFISMEPNNSYSNSNCNIFKRLAKNISDSNLKKYFDIDNSRHFSLYPSIQNLNQFKSNDNSNDGQLMKKSNYLISKEDVSSSFIDNNSKSEVNNKNEDNRNINLNINNLKSDKSPKIKPPDILQIQKVARKLSVQNRAVPSMFEKIEINDYERSNSNDEDIIYLKILFQKYFQYKKKSFIYERTTIEEVNKFFSLKKYIYSPFCDKRAKRYHYVMEKFRVKLLSEEHFFRTHNYLYLFEKCFDLQESKKIDIIELYKNL